MAWRSRASYIWLFLSFAGPFGARRALEFGVHVWAARFLKTSIWSQKYPNYKYNDSCPTYDSLGAYAVTSIPTIITTIVKLPSTPFGTSHGPPSTAF